MDFSVDLERSLGRKPRPYHYALPLVNAGLRAVLGYRMARALRTMRLGFIASLIKRGVLMTTGAEISPAASIGPGFRLPHPHGVVIGPGVTIDRDCTVFQRVTIGPRRADATLDDTPVLEPETYVYAGAAILGPVRIGERTQVGPNCVVFQSLDPGSTVLPPKPTVLEGLSFSLRAGETAESSPADVVEGATS